MTSVALMLYRMVQNSLALNRISYWTSVHLNAPSDIAYLTKLAREEPGLYAKLASRDGGLQGYVAAMGEFN